MTLEEISRQSGISTAMFTFLEACDFEQFGAPLLIRNTIRAYCKALPIEPEALIAKFSSEIEKYSFQDLEIKKYGLRMKVLHRKRRMICLPLLALLLSPRAYFMAECGYRKSAQCFSPRLLPTGFSHRKNSLPNYRNALHPARPPEAGSLHPICGMPMRR